MELPALNIQPPPALPSVAPQKDPLSVSTLPAEVDNGLELGVWRCDVFPELFS